MLLPLLPARELPHGRCQHLTIHAHIIQHICLLLGVKWLRVWVSVLLPRVILLLVQVRLRPSSTTLPKGRAPEVTGPSSLPLAAWAAWLTAARVRDEGQDAGLLLLGLLAFLWTQLLGISSRCSCRCPPFRRLPCSSCCRRLSFCRRRCCCCHCWLLRAVQERLLPLRQLSSTLCLLRKQVQPPLPHHAQQLPARNKLQDLRAVCHGSLVSLEGLGQRTRVQS